MGGEGEGPPQPSQYPEKQKAHFYDFALYAHVSCIVDREIKGLG